MAKINVPNYVVLDFETGGFSKDNNKSSSAVVAMTQVALMVVDGISLKELGRYSEYILPYDTKLEYQPEAQKITGITTDMLWEKGKDLKTVFKNMSELINSFKQSSILKSTIVGQNIPFDVDFLVDGYNRVNIDISKYFYCKRIAGMNVPSYIDTIDLGRMAFPKANSHKLGALCEYLGIDYIDGHDAMNDVVMTYEAFKASIQRLRSDSIEGEQTEIKDVRKTFEWM